MVRPLLGRLRLAVAAPRLCLHAVLGTAIIAFVFPFSSRERRNALVRWWSHRLLTIAGVLYGYLRHITGSVWPASLRSTNHDPTNESSHPSLAGLGRPLPRRADLPGGASPAPRS